MHELRHSASEDVPSTNSGRARHASDGNAIAARFRGFAVGEVPPVFRNVGTCKLVSEMGRTCLALVPLLFGNRLLPPVSSGAEPSPGAFAVRDRGRWVRVVACVAEVAVPTRVVVVAPANAVFGVFRMDFVRWADWADEVGDGSSDRAVETPADYRLRGSGDYVSRGGFQRSSELQDLFFIRYHITVVEAHFPFSARVSCVAGGRVGTVVGRNGIGVIGVGGSAGVVVARHHGFSQGSLEMFLLRELFAKLVEQMLMVFPVAPAGVSAATR